MKIGHFQKLVIPANAGIQDCKARNRLDPGIRRGDESPITNHQSRTT